MVGDRYIAYTRQATSGFLSLRIATVAGLEAIRETSITELGARLESNFQFGSAEEWIARIRSVGLSAHVLVNYEESMETLLVKQRGLSVVRNHPEIGDVRSVGSPAKLSRTPVLSLFGAPPLGRHARGSSQRLAMAIDWRNASTREL
jgi:crotonobetainyl-CoA:carnitine CoA-transferase CaiB-like acyl-CoA transferase